MEGWELIRWGLRLVFFWVNMLKVNNKENGTIFATKNKGLY